MIGISAIIALLLVCLLIYYFSFSKITFLDRPYFLSNKRETIEVGYVMWSCDCADFVETKNHKSDDFIFIEAADPSLIVPEEFYASGHFTRNLRLTGQFYKKEGVSRTYELKTPQKPEWARVFRYDKIEIVDRKPYPENYNPQYNK
ncbi:MAG TPA: hypothetical protein VGE24_12750 [Emticicia sp.]